LCLLGSLISSCLRSFPALLICTDILLWFSTWRCLIWSSHTIPLSSSVSISIAIGHRRATIGWRNVISGWVVTIISIAGWVAIRFARRCVVVAPIDSRHSTIDKPVGDGALTRTRQEAGGSRDCASIYIIRFHKV